MNIVFITHYFPPLNSSGARRINAFAKYLASRGHKITVVSTRKSKRDGLLTEVLPDYLSLLELDTLGRISKSRFVIDSVDNTANVIAPGTRSMIGRVLLTIKRSVMKIAGQLLDHRVFFAFSFAFPWLASDVKKAISDADIIMSSCPPWPTHLAGRLAKSRSGKLWVADYRDQFSGSHILRGSVLSRPIEVLLERWLIKPADHVVVISKPMEEYYKQFHANVTCIENGYEPSVFESARENVISSSNKYAPDEFVIRYMGTISSDRIPLAFFGALVQLNQQVGLPVVAEFYGESSLLRKTLPNVAPLAHPYVRFCSQLPYAQAVERMLSADALLFIETSDFSSHSARGVLTTKLFEYLAARKPVVAEISSLSLAAQYIRKSGLGLVMSTEVNEILYGLDKLRSGGFKPMIDDQFIRSLSRQVKAQELEQLFFRIVEKKSVSSV